MSNRSPANAYQSAGITSNSGRRAISLITSSLVYPQSISRIMDLTWAPARWYSGMTSCGGITVSSQPFSKPAAPLVLYSNVRITRLFEQVAQQIEASIVEGVFGAGDRLPSERQLAQRCGVSRNVVREAVKRLSQKGLVETRSGRGTFVIARTLQV
jgi:hypothetical protein